MEVQIASSKQEVAEEFAAFFAEQAAAHEQFHVALSGGSTPKIVFDCLAKEYASSIDWSKVHFYWGDERCVPPTDDDSNYKMTETHLLSKIKIPETNVHRIFGELKPQEAADRYGLLLEKELPIRDEVPRFDLTILGMGDDGHTASIFPHEIDLWGAKPPCVVATHPNSGQKRVSLTGKVINASKTVAFLVTGASKAPKVAAIINQEDQAKKYPAALVAPHSGALTWFLDLEAASALA